MKKLRFNSNLTIYEKDDKVYKVFNENQIHLTEDWLKQYKDFNNTYKILPEIYELNKKLIVMEKISGISMHDYIEAKSHENPEDWTCYFESAKIIAEIKFCFADYSFKRKKWCGHNDISTSNIIMNSANDWRLIDVESVDFTWPCITFISNEVEEHLASNMIMKVMNK